MFVSMSMSMFVAMPMFVAMSMFVSMSIFILGLSLRGIWVSLKAGLNYKTIMFSKR